MNDGAGALVVASEDWAKANGKTPLAKIVAQASVADDFAYLARTPANATKAALEKAGLTVDDIDLFEINEAFASVPLNSVRMLGVDESKVNVNGGAIALGHPIGASGARILGALIHELRRRGGGLGVAAICSGGGQGDAVILEVAAAWESGYRSGRRSCSPSGPSLVGSSIRRSLTRTENLPLLGRRYIGSRPTGPA